ncbi:MAG: DnaA N-terminal domain-containing protein, partial [Candidatus Sulfotelmatobacter sp.]
MKEYAEIDAELRRLASVESPAEGRVRTWERRKGQTWLPELSRAFQRVFHAMSVPSTTLCPNPSMSVPSTALAPNPWMCILDTLEKKVNRHSYDTWLKPTRYSHSSGGILFVRVPTAEFRHAGDKYADLIQEAIDNLGLEF